MALRASTRRRGARSRRTSATVSTVQCSRTRPPLRATSQASAARFASDREASFSQIGVELIEHAHIVLEHCVVDLPPTDDVGIGGLLEPAVLEPENREPELVGET